MAEKYSHNESESIWKRILKEEPDARKRAERLLAEGIKALGGDLVMFDPILTCEALGEAEKADALDLQAEAYKRISMLWGKQYPALSLSIWRKAEKLFEVLGQEQELNCLRMNLALSCFLTGEKYAYEDADLAEKFRQEAGRIIQMVAEPNEDAAAMASFRYTKGTILRDTDLLRQARAFYEQESLWDAAIPCLDEEVRIALDKGERRQALPLMRLVQDYAMKSGNAAFANKVGESIDHIDTLENGPRFKGYKDGVPTLMDVLDILAYYEERVIFSEIYKANDVLGFALEEGKFMLMDGGRLMPTFREQMRLYRGETEFHKPCQPTLWRKDMDDQAVFIERLKLAEFERMLEQMPESYFFRTGVVITDPDGIVHHNSLYIDAIGLAQHYGIKTELLDLTADKWAAAFFASTTYDEKSDTYQPITVQTEKQGVVYHYPILPTSFDSNELSVVGAQPFERPTEQAAYMLALKKDDDFNAKCPDRVFFRQHPVVSLIVYHYANRAGRMFPNETIQEKTHRLVVDHDKTFCPEIINLVRQQYYHNLPDEAFRKLLEAITIGAPGAYRLQLSDEEKRVTWDHQLRFERLLSRVQVKWFTTMEWE